MIIVSVLIIAVIISAALVVKEYTCVPHQLGCQDEKEATPDREQPCQEVHSSSFQLHLQATDLQPFGQVIQIIIVKSRVKMVNNGNISDSSPKRPCRQTFPSE